LFILLLLFSLAVIDEDQKHIGDDASVRFIPSSANTVHQPLTLRTLAASFLGRGCITVVYSGRLRANRRQQSALFCE
jgi:hypothetical protein